MDARAEGDGKEAMETSSEDASCARTSASPSLSLSSLCISVETASKTNGGINLPQPFIDLD